MVTLLKAHSLSSKVTICAHHLRPNERMIFIQ